MTTILSKKKQLTNKQTEKLLIDLSLCVSIVIYGFLLLLLLPEMPINPAAATRSNAGRFFSSSGCHFIFCFFSTNRHYICQRMMNKQKQKQYNHSIDLSFLIPFLVIFTKSKIFKDLGKWMLVFFIRIFWWVLLLLF